MTVLSRDEAVEEIASLIVGREHFIVPTVARDAAAFPRWSAYLDAGEGLNLRLRAEEVETVTAGVPGLVGIVLACRTDDDAARGFRAAVDADLGPTEDLIFGSYGDGDAHAVLPRVFIDALDLVDPIAAARFRAHLEPL